MMRRLAIVIVLLAAACSSDPTVETTTGTSATSQSDIEAPESTIDTTVTDTSLALAAARQRWSENAEVQDCYSLDLTAVKLPIDIGRHVVAVAGGQIVSHETDPTLGLGTVEALFDAIDGIERDPTYFPVVVYDPGWGVPMSISNELNDGMIQPDDGGVSVVVQEFLPGVC